MARVHTTAFNETDCIGDCYEPINNSLANLDTAVQDLSALNVVDTSTIDLTYSTSSRSLTASVKDNSIDYTKVAPGMIIDCVNTHISQPLTYPVTSLIDREITALSAQITPKTPTSKILFQAMLNYEIQWDSVLKVKRSIGGSAFVEIGSGTPSGNRLTGMSAPGYDNNTDSTQHNNFLQYLDEPNTTQIVVYKVFVRRSGNADFYLNRTNADTNFPYMERTSSNVNLLEIKGA